MIFFSLAKTTVKCMEQYLEIEILIITNTIQKHNHKNIPQYNE